jgi:hypothetical protein
MLELGARLWDTRQETTAMAGRIPLRVVTSGPALVTRRRTVHPAPVGGG